ncbi:MAG: hypothetical protein ABUL58_08255 [Steroidobacter sp.]
MTRAYATTDHQRIRKWVEKRGGHPAEVAADGGHGLLCIDFDPPDEKLNQIDWSTFFDIFDRKSLAFLYQDNTSEGKPSRFSKFIERSSTEATDLEEEPDEETNADEKTVVSSRAK